MEFAFTDEQLMIKDTAESYLSEVSTSAAIRQAMETELGYDRQQWQSVCSDLYWQAIHTPDQFGGMALGYVELVAMQEQMGRFLFCSPFFSTVCLALNSLLLAATEEQKQHYIPLLLQGKTATLAFVGSNAACFGGQWDDEAIEIVAVKNTEGFRLSGEARYVIDAASSDYLIVAAKAHRAVNLFIVPADHDGIEVEWLPTMDQTRKQANLTFHDVQVPTSALLGGEADAQQTLTVILNLATIALAAEQMGGAQGIMDMAVEYSKERVQFGRAIAGFQAIKHKAADMMTRVEVARSGVYYAACIAEQALKAAQQGQAIDTLALQEAASICKAYCSDAYFKNAAQALQIHGGVGFTWEYDVHLHFKRAKASEHYLGNASYHRERLAQLLLEGEAPL